MTEERPLSTDDDEALSALLDGALPAEQAERLRQRLSRDPALARRFEALRNVDAIVHKVYAGLVDEPLPERVLAALQTPEGAGPDRPADVIELAPRLRPRMLGIPPAIAPPAIAAGIALVVGFVFAFLALPRTSPLESLAFIAGTGAVEEGSALYEVLQTTPSNESRVLTADVSAMPRLTFVSVDGAHCRQVDLTAAQGTTGTLACRRDGGWRIELVSFAAQRSPAAGEVYRPATDDASTPIGEAIDALIDGAPLGREAERELISRGWSDG